MLLVVGVAAGCGGSSTASVPNDSVAVVGSDHITKTQFTLLMNGTKRAYVARKTTFPKPGTTQYKALQDQTMKYLVQQSELEQKAKKLGIGVTDKDVQARIKQIKKQYFAATRRSTSSSSRRRASPRRCSRSTCRGRSSPRSSTRRSPAA